MIAETADLPTKFVKIVVTDDRGRYLLPDLPKATFNVWVRGYGLVDSAKVKAAPGKTLNLTAVAAPNRARGGRVLSRRLLVLPDPRAGEERVPRQLAWRQRHLAEHQEPGRLDSKPEVRRLHGVPPARHERDARDSESARHVPQSAEAWERRIQSGQAGAQMTGGLNAMGKDRALAMFADWTDRMAGGELPPAPPRPQGVERNVVITQWDWADPKAYLHDEVSTDRRNPTVNANGLIYGSLELSADYLPVLDPVQNKISQVPLTVRDPNTPRTSATMPKPSPYWGEEAIWTSRNNVHNPMFDEKGRVWITSAVRPAANPDFCKEGSTHPSAKLYPLANSGRQLAVYDPASKQIAHISTCFGTHHLMFAEDANRTLWTSGGGQVVGWLNTKMFDETHDEVKSQGWTALVLDTNGNGKRDAYVEPNQPLDPAKDKRYGNAFYAVAPAPDGSIWGSVLGFPGAVVRLNPGVESAGDGARRSVRAADAGLLAARRRCRSQRRLLDRARERPSGELRSPQMQGPAQWSEGDRAALSRGLVALRGAVATAQGRDGIGQRGSQLLYVGRLARFARSRRQRADRYRQRLGRSARAEGREVGRPPRAVSDRASTRNGWTAASTIRRRAGRAGDSGRR